MTDTDSDDATPTAATADAWVDAIVDCGAETLNEIRDDWDTQKQLILAEARQAQVDIEAALAPLRERIATLEGKMAVLLGSSSTNSPTRAKRSKQAPTNGERRLLEHRPQ
jgi:hypothetical protein